MNRHHVTNQISGFSLAIVEDAYCILHLAKCLY